MRRLGGKVMTIALATLFLLCLIPLPVQAMGIGVGPATLKIGDALRGAEYDRLITVFNPGDEASVYTVGADGGAAGWMSFSLARTPDTQIEEVSVSAHGEAGVMVKIVVPKDAANGEHKATIVVTSVPAAGTGGQAVALSAQVAVSVTVTGTQNLSGTVNNIGIEDAEVGYPLVIRVHFTNTGNVVAEPQIGVEITKDDATIEKLFFNQTKVRPEKSESIVVEWNTTGKVPGNYVGNVAVSLGTRVIATEQLKFAILPVGTLTRAGVLQGLALEGKPTLGTLAKVQAIFLNTGQIATRTKFVGEVYCDLNLVATLASEEILIPVGRQDTLVAYFKPEQEGIYSIKGHVIYEGKKTEVKELSFTIAGGGGGGASTTEAAPQQPFNLLFLAIGVIGLLIMAVAYSGVRGRRRHL